MGSKPSKEKSPTSVKSKIVVIPTIPQEITDYILDYLAADLDFRSLRSCALVCKSWVPSCRRHLFHTIRFTSRDMTRWLETFPSPEESPAHHVRDLRFSLGGSFGAPSLGFSEHTPWFTNVERMTWMGLGRFLPSLGRLPQSVTSLTIDADTVTLTQIRDILMQLPNLDNLSLSGSLTKVDRNTLPGMGTVLRGRFKGRLRLFGGQADEDVVNMLLEVPAGLHFTEVHICDKHEGFLSIVKLVEACSKTLVKLSYTISVHDRREAFEQSFDFSTFPYLQEVDFGVGWVVGGLPWIPAALLTLKRATSPRLSALQLNFVDSSPRTHPVETSIADMGSDLRQAAGEVARIEREYEGAVKLNVPRDPRFKVAFDTLNIF